MHISLTPFSYFIYSTGITLMAFNIIGVYNIMSDRIKTLHLQSIEVLAYLILLPICLYKPWNAILIQLSIILANKIYMNISKIEIWGIYICYTALL